MIPLFQPWEACSPKYGSKRERERDDHKTTFPLYKRYEECMRESDRENKNKQKSQHRNIREKKNLKT